VQQTLGRGLQGTDLNYIIRLESAISAFGIVCYGGVCVRHC
jgi:hypothetical protein